MYSIIGGDACYCDIRCIGNHFLKFIFMKESALRATLRFPMNVWKSFHQLMLVEHTSFTLTFGSIFVPLSIVDFRARKSPCSKTWEHFVQSGHFGGLSKRYHSEIFL